MKMIRGPRESTILPQTGAETYTPAGHKRNIKKCVRVIGSVKTENCLPFPARPTMLS